MPAPRPATTRPTAVNASAAPTVVGLRAWGAVLVAVILTVLGAILDGLVSGHLTWGFRLGFFAGAALAALAVRRGSIFTALVQPPLVMVVVIYIALRMLAADNTKRTITLIQVVDAFPTMLIGTVLAVLICVVRIFAQPIRRPRPTTTPAPHPSHA